MQFTDNEVQEILRDNEILKQNLRDAREELEATDPKVLVLSSGGSGVPVYRRLQKEDTPFIAGVLAENDIDYQLARLLAAEVITTPAFEPISEEAFARAMQAVESCTRVIATEFPIGTANSRISRIIEAAEKSGKLERN